MAIFVMGILVLLSCASALTAAPSRSLRPLTARLATPVSYETVASSNALLKQVRQ